MRKSVNVVAAVDIITTMTKNMNTTIKTIQIPGLSISNIFIKNKRLVLGKNTYRVNT